MNLPKTVPEPDFQIRDLTLREYALFSYKCLEANPDITPENVMEDHRGEACMKAFHIRPR